MARYHCLWGFDHWLISAISYCPGNPGEDWEFWQLVCRLFTVDMILLDIQGSLRLGVDVMYGSPQNGRKRERIWCCFDRIDCESDLSLDVFGRKNPNFVSNVLCKMVLRLGKNEQ